ncbi:FAD-dependent oxidoreductase [Streptomyces sp. P38-E01]|uniref:FAD-dependent oxidoreductase n=1 Tax=Streptomyces tardus TaxID=2780544 RepID=A0A949JCN3_9ACTN|nr:FAD-dependent oxidoreductase [Streptomyces tardus]MBU7596578.1 FAD-dependent oxidoreductase [Streptomyces tardus]
MVDAHRTFVIIGGGLAGAKAAETLRAEGFTGRVILVGDERDHPYERPALSKGYLSGEAERESLLVQEPAWYAREQIELHLGQPAVRIDREAHEVTLGDGTVLPYDALLLATGAEPRRLDVPGTQLAGVHHLRRLSHADQLRGVLARLGRENGQLVIVGGGWIGLEAAAAARTYGAEVTVIESEPGPLHSVLGPEMGGLFTDLHSAHGVRFHFGARLTEITGHDGQVLAVQTDDGEEHPAHGVLAAIGAAPRTSLAASAGLELDERTGGIAVDESLRSVTDPAVYAAGDAAAAHHPLLGTRLRVEHWANALNGGPTAARAMLGREVRHDRLPYFFSDQYDLGLEYSGWAPAGSYDQVVCRGDVGKPEFIAFWLREGRVLAGMNVNVWDRTEEIQQLVRSAEPVDPERLADHSVPLTALL